MTISKEVHEKLLKNFSDYANGLPDKIKEIEILFQLLKENWNQEVVSQFYRKVHNLHGSAGMYGFTTLANIATELEAQINALKNQPIINEEQLTSLEKFLTELKQTPLAPEKPFLPPLAETKETKTTTTKTTNKNVYLLDNDRDASTKLTTQAEAFNYKITFYSELDALAEAVKKQPPLAIIININLFENLIEKSLDELKSKLALGTIPIIFIAKDVDFSLRLAAVRLGGSAFIIKPIAIEEITKELDKLFIAETSQSRILIIDDEIEIAKHFATLLEQNNMQTQTVTNAVQAEKALHDFNPDLILSDLHMPECEGNELVTLIHQQKTHENVPIIFLSSEEDKNKQLEAMRAGADDFINKNSKADYIISAIKNRLRRSLTLQNMITKDSLTGALNHTAILQQLNIEINKARPIQATLSIALIDLDNLRRINDKFGYNAGDQLLKGLSVLMRSRLRETTIIGRYAGAKFLVIMPNTGPEMANHFITELGQSFISLHFLHKNEMFNTTIGAGIAAYPFYSSSEKLLEAAEAALEKAKKQGINHVELAPNMAKLEK